MRPVHTFLIALFFLTSAYAATTELAHCCKVNESMLWKKSIQGLGPEASVIQPLFNYSFIVPELQLNAGLSYYGSAVRLRKFLKDVIGGTRPLKIGIVGGSVSFGKLADHIGQDDWFSLVVSWLAALTPQRVSGRNGCLPGTPSAYMVLCLQYFVEEDVDLVFVEYTRNDGTEDKLINNDVVTTMERLIRRILNLPGRPAVVLMHVPLVTDTGYIPYFLTMEHLESSLSYYYGIPTVSTHTMEYQYAVQYPVPGMEYDKNYIVRHPGTSGHKAMADLVVHLFQHVALDLVLRPVTLQETRQLATPLFGPMYPGNEPLNFTSCVIGSGLTSLVLSSTGWTWVDEGTDKSPKWGYVATHPDDALVLRLNTVRPGANGTASIPVMFYYLMSYTNMGIARFDCISGCTCEPLELDSYTHEHVSLSFVGLITVTPAEHCDVQIRVLNKTTSGGHKFKLTGVVIAEANNNDKLKTYNPAQLLFDYRHGGA